MAKYFKFENGVLESTGALSDSYGMGILSFSEANESGNEQVNGELVEHLRATKFTSYERCEKYQYIVLNTPTTMDESGLYDKILIYMDMRGILVFGNDGDRLAGIVGDFADKITNPSLPFFLSAFLLGLLAHDYIYIEGVEKQLGKLETRILCEHTPNCAEEINTYRRKVAVIKRYYEQLYEVTKILSEEEFLSEATDEFTKINEKVERLREEALYLRDYMSQVREAYQQAVDLSLNSVMKFLTAITLVFSPMMFMVGWYGMNFNMPETEAAQGYIIPFAITALIILVTVFIFKKRKWF